MPKEGTDASGAVLRWLHLSDLHLTAEEPWDRRATLQALVRHVKELKEQGLAPNWVFVTGDIAWSGKKAEYDQALRLFEELAKTLDLDLKQDFFVVPGNHDVDRGQVKGHESRLIKGLESQQEIEEVLRDPATMALLGRRLDAFYAFTERLFGPARGWRTDRPWRVDEREGAGIKVGILQLNSAWTSGSNEERTLFVGEAQVRDCLAEASDAQLRIALVHHPIADLVDVDRESLAALGAPEGVHLMLRGHLHRPSSISTASPDGHLGELAAGALYTTDSYPRRYLVTEVAPAQDLARVRFFSYSKGSRGFWAKDTHAYERAPEGVWEFQVGLASSAAEPAGEHRKTHRITAITRYRKAAAAVHGTVRLVGFADSRPRPNVQVPELFVPLRLTRPQEGGKKEKDWTTAGLLKALLAPRKRDRDRAARLVVLGGPGSGKTTLCRYAAVLIAGGATLEGVTVKGELLPLFLPFREYVLACEKKGQSLLDFLIDQAKNHLQLVLPEGFLEQALEEGRAVLLLDGLDEVGSAAERSTMCDRVKAFCTAYPQVPVLVTSRIAGYDEAPLSGRGEDGFLHLQLDPFNGDDLSQFVRNWYAVQEPLDPVARDRGVEELGSAFRADPRVRELARNPLLATLIALVHRFEAHLPGERAKLYELCVKTLLETWPAARKRRFEEIDEGLQRAYLEALAYRMQAARDAGEREVAIGRGELVGALVEIVEQRGTTGAAPEASRRMIERWVRFLEEGTGLLIEQRPGVFAFLHLSFLEYLAACALEREENLVDAISRRFKDQAWQEVCLLSIGRKATDKAFLDELYGNLAKRRGPERWSFLLRCLREEADFDDQQREAIVRGTGRALLNEHSENWSEVQDIFHEVVYLSLRHAEWAQTWVARELATTRGKALQAIVAMMQDQAGVIANLKARDDAGSAAAALLDFWPGSSPGRWAPGVVLPEEALAWGRKGIGELAGSRALTAMALGDERIAPGLLAGLIRTTADISAFGQTCAGSLAERPRPGGTGLPTVMKVEPGRARTIAVPLWPLSCLGENRDFDSYFDRNFNHDFGRNFNRCFTRKFIRDLTHALFWNFSHGLSRAYDRGFDRNLDFPFNKYYDQYFDRHYVLGFSRGSGADSEQGLNRLFDREFVLDVTGTTTEQVATLPAPNEVSRSEGLSRWRAVLKLRPSVKEVLSAMASCQAHLRAEIWTALATTVESAPVERGAYFGAGATTSRCSMPGTSSIAIFMKGQLAKYSPSTSPSAGPRRRPPGSGPEPTAGSRSSPVPHPPTGCRARSGTSAGCSTTRSRPSTVGRSTTRSSKGSRTPSGRAPRRRSPRSSGSSCRTGPRRSVPVPGAGGRPRPGAASRRPGRVGGRRRSLLGRRRPRRRAGQIGWHLALHLARQTDRPLARVRDR